MGSDVLVIGGGVIGSSIAWRLAQAGVDVCVLDRGTPGAEASSAAAGILAPQAEAPGPGDFLRLGIASREMYPDFAQELREITSVDVGYRPCGALELARTPQELSELTERLGWQSAAGLACAPISAREIAEREAALGPGWAGGFHLSREAQVDTRALVQALMVALEKYRVQFQKAPVAGLVLDRGRVTGVRLQDGSTRYSAKVVIAAGAWSSLLEGGETPIRIEPVRGQMVELGGPPGKLKCVTFVPGGYLVPRDDGRILVGSTSERVGFDKRVTANGIETLLRRARESSPELAGLPLLSTWAGLRPATGDGLPLLGAHPTLQGLLFATGHFRNGILLAPITARVVASQVLGRSDVDPSTLTAFRPGRAGAAAVPPAQ